MATRPLARVCRRVTARRRSRLTDDAVPNLTHPRPRQTLAAKVHRALPLLGGLAVLVGAAVGILLSAPGVDRRVAALAGLASIMWAGIRWVALRLAAPRAFAENPAAARDAVWLGLLVYAIAVTPELRFAAWLISGGGDGRGAHPARSKRGEVVRAVGIAWGAQAVVVAGGWLARSALLVLLAAGG